MNEDYEEINEIVKTLLAANISSVRSEVIDNSVKIELLINGLLLNLFGLGKSNTISFGNTSAALSFISKVNLLFDFKILSKNEKEKLKTFAEIRNKFAHDFKTSALNDCPVSILNELQKWYLPNVKRENIPDFLPLYKNLYSDVIESVSQVTKKLIDMAAIKGNGFANAMFNDFLYQEMETYCEADADFRAKFLSVLDKANDVYKNTILPDDMTDGLSLL